MVKKSQRQPDLDPSKEALLEEIRASFSHYSSVLAELYQDAKVRYTLCAILEDVDKLGYIGPESLLEFQQLVADFFNEAFGDRGANGERSLRNS